LRQGVDHDGFLLGIGQIPIGGDPLELRPTVNFDIATIECLMCRSVFEVGSSGNIAITKPDV
jgi:hypothetical protein